jgi:hypothetical protein
MVASKDSAVRRCPCSNSPTSAASNSPDPAASRRSLRDRPSSSRHVSSVTLDLRLLILASVSTQPTRSSSTFHIAASTPPGTRTLAISGSARFRSNQCRAWPTTTASTAPSGSGMSSALPGSDRTEGSSRRSSASMSGCGSTAVTSAPSPMRVVVSLPVPAPTSSARTGLAEIGSSAQRTAASA